MLLWPAIENERLASDLSCVLGKEPLPFCNVAEVEVHEDWVVCFLNVDINVFTAHDCVQLHERTDWISQSDVQMARLADFDATEFVLLNHALVVVALARNRVPNFKAALVDGALTHDIYHMASWES